MLTKLFYTFIIILMLVMIAAQAKAARLLGDSAVLHVSVKILECKTYEQAKNHCDLDNMCCEIMEAKKDR